MRVVFMGTPLFAMPSLAALVEASYEVCAVYTQPDRPAGRGRGLVQPPVKEAALGYGLLIRQPSSLKPPQEMEALAGLKPDVIVVAAYGQLLPQQVLDIPRFGCLNVHPSLLPRHRGASPVAGAILAGDEVTGVTIMLLDAGLDTGPLLSQRQVPVLPQDTTGSLTDKLAGEGAQLLVMETLPRWPSGELTPQPQDEEQATYTPQIDKESGRVDWHLPAEDLWRRVRAYQPWPGCYTTWKGRTVRLLEAVPLDGEGQPGMVVRTNAADAPVGVNAGHGVLGLVRVQLEGKRAVSAEDFVRGQRDFVGALLPS